MQRQSVRDLPTDKTPIGTRCIQIEIPDSDEWERDLYGEIWRLTRWNLWERDSGKYGKPIADRWLQAIRTWKHCDGTPSPVGGLLEDFELPLRVDCDCNVWVTCCDGTEKQILTADQVLAAAGQPGAGSPQPTPGGGCQQYHGTLQANGRWLVPTIVSTGDTIELGGAVGATNDGSEIIWHCPDGSQFFGGICTASGGLSGSDPLPSVEHMRIIVNVDGTFYDALSGPITVPMGVTNAPVYVQVNDDVLTDNAGSVSFDITVCNNQDAVWNVNQNMELTAGGWTTDIPGTGGGQSIWTPASGWASVDCYNLLGGSGRYNVVFIRRVFAAPVHIKHFDMTFNAVVGDLADSGHQLVNLKQGATDNAVINVAPTTGDGQFMYWNGDLTGVTEIQLLLYGADHNDATCPPTGSALLRSVNMSGVGTPPF